MFSLTPTVNRSRTVRAFSLVAVASGSLPALSAGNALAAVDCDKLAHSTEPYEVTMKVGEVALKYQVLRTKEHMTTLLVRQLDGQITKLTNQSTFPKTMTMPNGQSATFEYSVPTDKPIYEQAPKHIEMKLKHNADVLMSTPVNLQYFPDEKVKVGECTFDTKHYVQTSAQNGRESRNEIWYSPDLDFSIKGSSMLKASGQEVSKASQATELTTSFTPFK